MKLLFEETCLLERAQAQGYVTSDGRDNYDPVLEAYRDWCRVQRRPFLHLALGEATARVIFSLLEAETVWRVKTEKQLRQRIPTFCLSQAEIEMEPDYLIVGRVVNERLSELQDGVEDLSLGERAIKRTGAALVVPFVRSQYPSPSTKEARDRRPIVPSHRCPFPSNGLSRTRPLRAARGGLRQWNKRLILALVHPAPKRSPAQA